MSPLGKDATSNKRTGTDLGSAARELDDPGAMPEITAADPPTALEEGAVCWAEGAEGGSASAPPARKASGSPSGAKRRARAEPAPPLDPRLRPFAHALADLLLADLLKYPPRTS